MGRHSRSRSRGRPGPAEEAYDDVQDGYRVHVADLGVDCSQKELERQFGKFGDFREIWLAKNPPCFAFIVFKHRSDAEEAIKEMDNRVVCNARVRCSWAKPRTRGRNARFDPEMRCFQCGDRGHFSRDCNGKSRRHDDRRTRHRRSRSRSRSRRRDRRSKDRSRSPRRHKRSRSRSNSRERRRRHRSRSHDRHQRRSKSRSRSRSTRRSANTTASPAKQIVLIETNGSQNGASAAVNGHRSKSKSKEPIAHGNDNGNGTNGDMYDPTRSDEDDEFVKGSSPNGHLVEAIVNADYHSGEE